jgi:hypothetical protein
MWCITNNVGEPEWDMSGSPVVEGNVILLNAGGKGHGIRKDTREVLWSSTGEASYTTPLVFDWGGQRVMALRTAGGAVWRNVATGAELWSCSVPSAIVSTDAVKVGTNRFLLASQA